ncbi:hypothetical protein RAA17_10115 [Komagataeibacter rhaeticus]|nr:hypothetical protein [Komagataeibacter rhaeticus]
MLPVVIFGAKLRPDGTAARTLRCRVEAAHAFGRQHGAVVYHAHWRPFMAIGPDGGQRDGPPAS